MEKPNTMFAWQYTSAAGGIDKHLRYTPSTHLPRQPPNSTLVKVLRASINPVDYKIPEMPLVSRFIGRPATAGCDFVGRVVNAGTPGFESGDLVVGRLSPGQKHGSLAEYIVVKPPKENMVKVDESAVRDGKIDELVGSGVAGSAALRSLKGVPAGGRVFINGGSGGTGMFGVQIAKVFGLEVVATCSGRNSEFVRKLGADEVIDYTKSSVVEALKASVQRTGRKFDRVVDNVGTNPELYWKAHEYLADGKEYVMVGAPAAFGGLLNLAKMALWPTVLGGGKRKFRPITSEPNTEEVKEVADLIMEGKVRAEIEKFKLDEVPKAIERLKTGRTRGKIVIKISDESQ